MNSEPFYFGRKEHLFGFYYPEGVTRHHAVVICPPLLDEYMRCHLALRELASRLSGLGYAVLRFDFSGQGNSPQHSRDVKPRDWITDVQDAVKEVRNLSGIEKVSIVAVRYSAAVVAAGEHSAERFVFWDPVFSGREWLNDLKQLKNLLKARHAGRDVVGDHEWGGYAMAPEFPEYLEEADFEPTGRAAATIVRSCNRDETTTWPNATVVDVDSPCEWSSLKSSVMFPHSIVTTLEWEFH